MKKAGLIIIIAAASFGLGFVVKTMTSKDDKQKSTMKKVTGIGGVFFKCKDPEKIRDWYQKNLGLDTNPYGASFEWYESPDSTTKATTQWTPFKESTKYFEPSSKDFMINYRVENLQALVDELKASGVTVVDSIETYDYGKFVHIMDPEGNKIQLWEPKD